MRYQINRFLVGFSIVGPVWYMLAVVFACLLYPSYNPLVQSSSELTARSAPAAAALVMNSGLVAFGLSLFTLASSLSRLVNNSRWLRGGYVLIAAFGLVAISSVFFPMGASPDPSSWISLLHGVIYVLTIAVVPSLLLLSAAFSKDSKFRPYRWYTFLTPFLMLALTNSGLVPGGLADFIGTSAVCVWAIIIGLALLLHHK